VIGVVANPVSGKDVRRLLSNASTSTLDEKVSVVRRLLVGAVEAGEDRFLLLPDAHGICRRARSTLQLDATVEDVDLRLRHDESDTVAAAGAMAEAGCGAVLVLGGDGTNRAVAIGWPDAPVLPLSTGTNNVFPRWVEATVAGAAAAIVATGAVPLADVARRSKLVRIEVEGERDDLALVDAVLLADHSVGSRRLFEPSRLRVAVLARAEPASVGVSSIGGLLLPCGDHDEGGVVVRFGAGGRPQRAPIAPGLYADVPVTGVAGVAMGEPVEVVGPGVLAFDGERARTLAEGQRATLRVERAGPFVIDAGAALRLGRDVFRRS
jgi:predicted polyphosphate/ATP-dependent NAD kinase